MAATPAAILLPRADGTQEPYVLGPALSLPDCHPVARSRVAYAAAHVVADPLRYEPAGPARLDWDVTLAVRERLWGHGLGVAEAMDTAQRGMGLDWLATQELIRRSCAAARAVGGRIACGAGTDQLQVDEPAAIDDVRRAYAEQCAWVEEHGGTVVVMASRALARAAGGPDDYHAVYGELLQAVRAPAILHWLGEVFDPALRGYWGSTDLDAATEVVLALIQEHAACVDGIKVSLLDAEREIELRRRLPASVRLYTGDDFGYPALIAGDGTRHSDALLGILTAIAPIAAEALLALDDGDEARFHDVLEPTLPLARHVFAAPTYHYKTGLVFLAFLNGEQSHFRMLGGLESMRSVVHLAELFALADRAGLLRDPELAAGRMRGVLALAGV